MGFAGQYRRSCEIIDELEIIIGAENPEAIILNIDAFAPLTLIQGDNAFHAVTEAGLKVKVILTEKAAFYLEWFKTKQAARHMWIKF